MQAERLRISGQMFRNAMAADVAAAADGQSRRSCAGTEPDAEPDGIGDGAAIGEGAAPWCR